MTDFQREITNRVETFVAEITRLARDAAARLLLEGLDKRASRPAARTPAAPGAKRRRRKGGKRPAGEISRLAETLASYVSNHPGLRIEEIGKGMGIATRELAFPVKKLIAGKRIRSKGQRRATRYFPGSGRAAKK